MWCDKVGAVLFKVLYFIGKFLGLVAFDYDFSKRIFHTSIPATVMSSVISIFVVVISPLAIKWNWEIYFVSGVDIDENMSLITAAQIGFGFLTSFVVLVCQLVKRKHVSRTANCFQNVHSQLTGDMGCGRIVTVEIIFLVAMKLCITMYEVLVNFPYLVEHGANITPERFVAFFLNLYVAEISAVYSDVVFAGLLLLARYFHLVDELLGALMKEIQADGVTETQMVECKARLLRLIRFYLEMKGIVAEVSCCIGVAIFVQMLHSFANMLTNLYAVLDFYAVTKDLEIKDVAYNVMIFVNICLLIHAAERVRKRSADLRDTFLELDASRGDINSVWRSDVLVFQVWPEVFEVDIIGLFPLNNTFLLFLFAYASNFVVIILQFELTRVV